MAGTAKKAAVAVASRTPAGAAATAGAGAVQAKKTPKSGTSPAGGKGGQKSTSPAGGKGGQKSTSPRGDGVHVKSYNWLGGRKMLTAQYVLVLVIVGLGALLSGDEDKNDVVLKALIKSSALSLLFFLLALLSNGGKGAAKAANGFGTLVTAAYVFTSSDVHSILTWIGSFFSHEHKPSSKSGSGSSGSGGAAGGAAEDLGKAAGDILTQGADQVLKGEATGSSQLVNTGELLAEG